MKSLFVTFLIIALSAPAYTNRSYHNERRDDFLKVGPNTETVERSDGQIVEV